MPAVQEFFVAPGTTSFIAMVFIEDSTLTGTTEAGKTGLTNASLTAYYARTDQGNAAATVHTLAGGTRGTWSSGGFIEKDAANMPGWYELGVFNAALAAGVRDVVVNLKGAGTVTTSLLIHLQADVNMTAINAGLTSGNNAVLKLKALDITANDGTQPVTIRNSDSGGTGVPCVELRSDDVAGGNVLLIRSTDVGGGVPVYIATNATNTTAVEIVPNGTAPAVLLGTGGASSIQGNLVGKVTGAGAVTITGVGVQASVSGLTSGSRPGG